MIADTLDFLQGRLRERLALALAPENDGANPLHMDFVKYEGDAIKFPEGISMLLLNLEEERVMRAPDPYSRPANDGSRVRVQPEVRLILYVLLVAHLSDSSGGKGHYSEAWRRLSLVLECFRTNRVFERPSTPDLPPSLERLVLELVTLTLAEQNDVWAALRSVHHPSLLYRVKLLAYHDGNGVPTTPIAEIETSVRGMP